MGSARKFSIHVEPSSLLAHETADLVQAVGATADLVARDEFHRGAVCRFRRVFLHFQSQPLRVVRRESKRGGAGVGGPGGQQGGFQFEHISAVARAHKGCGIRCGSAVVVTAATGGVVCCAAGAREWFLSHVLTWQGVEKRSERRSGKAETDEKAEFTRSK